MYSDDGWIPHGSSRLADTLCMKFLVFIMLFSSAAFADWKIGTQKLELVQCSNGTCMISKDCSSCLALKASQNKQKSDVGPGGANPGSAVCTKFHKAGVIIAPSAREIRHSSRGSSYRDQSA